MEKTGSSIRIGVVGIGGMGKRWAQIASEHPDSALVAVCHLDRAQADDAAKQYGCAGYTNWQDVVRRSDVDAVVVSTPHVFLTDVSQAALASGKHVFCEKPGGVSSVAIQRGVDLAEKQVLRYRVNFHLRLHPAIALAKKKIDQGDIGGLLFLRAVYGHGAREGYANEWWCKEELSGGGDLIDQGSHLLDLAQWFMGPFRSQSAFLDRAFWPIAPLEDNIFLLLKNELGRVAQLHGSWTHWKKTFRLELFGENGYLLVHGLGGQYGLERLTHGERAFGREPPKEEVLEFPSEPGKPDTALKDSWDEFVRSIREGRAIGQSAAGAVEVLKLIESGYRSQKETNN